MKIIGEYETVLAHSQTITLPVGAEFIHVGTMPSEPDTPVLWVLHEQIKPETVLMNYEVMMASGSTEFDESFNLKHIGSFPIRGNSVMVHAFQRLGV